MNIYLIIAICLIVFLVVLFVVSFVFNKKTPIPENCKNMFDEASCDACKQYDCAFNKIHDEIEEVRKENE